MTAFENEVEEYIRSLPWSPDATEDEKALIIGNIRTSARLFRAKALAEAERLCRDPRSYRRPETAAEDLADAIAKLAEVERG